MEQANSRVDLADRVVIVTGAARGLGLAAAKFIAERGAAVTLSDVDVKNGRAACAAIEEAGGRAMFIRADVSSESDVVALVAGTVKHFGKLNGAVNNAGILGTAGDIGKMSLTQWQKVIGVNLTGVFLCLKYEVQYMVAHGGGSIVNIASAAGLIGVGGTADYCASKHGVIGLTKVASTEYSSRGVRVNAVAPGAIDSPMNQQSLGDPVIAHANARQPIGRIGKPFEVTEAVAWMLSEASSFVTGTVLSVDAGYASV